MNDFLLIKNHFLLDLIASVPVAAYIGRALRVQADSGLEYNPEKYMHAAIAGAVAMVIAVVIASGLQYKLRLIPSFLLLGIIGPLFFALSIRLVIYVESLRSASLDLREAFGPSVPFAIFLVIPFVLYLLFIRLAAFVVVEISNRFGRSQGRE